MSTLINTILFCLAINFCVLTYFIYRFFKIEDSAGKCITESLMIRLQTIINITNDIRKEQQKITSKLRKIEGDVVSLKFELQRKKRSPKNKKENLNNDK